MRKHTATICALGVTAALAASAAPAAAKGGATEVCGPPGQSISQAAKLPGSTREAFDGPPGQVVSQFCAPGHQKDGGI
jgi:hypothetical protein